jgi:hypothetical protein
MRRPREVSIRSVPVRTNRPRCKLCGRERLSREEFNWRRKNGLAVWRCQHRRPSPTVRHDLIEAGGVIAALVVCIVVLWPRRS